MRNTSNTQNHLLHKIRLKRSLLAHSFAQKRSKTHQKGIKKDQKSSFLMDWYKRVIFLSLETITPIFVIWCHFQTINSFFQTVNSVYRMARQFTVCIKLLILNIKWKDNVFNFASFIFMNCKLAENKRFELFACLVLMHQKHAGPNAPAKRWMAN